MWENEGRKTLIRNIVIFLILVIVAAGLVTAMISVKKQIEAEDELLSAEHSSQRQEQSAARQENLDVVQKAYEADLQTLQTYLPGIVCWGDSLTAGSSGNVSYPYTLQTYLDTYLCDIYDLHYSIENAEEYARLDWDSYKISIPVVNMGAGKENNATILGRSGVVPYVVKADFVIPGDTQPVAVTLASQDGRTVSPLTAGSAGVNPVTIAGVQGTLTRETDSQSWGPSTYYFTRLEAGAETPVAGGTEIEVACKTEYQDYIHVVWLGTYSEYTSAEKLVSDTKTLLQRQTGNPDRYLVIGPCTVGGSWTSATSTTMDAIDSAMLQAFGNHYINVRKYLMEDGLRDAGISASRSDTYSIAQGKVPDTFRSTAGGADLNGVAYKLVGKLVYERMERLGYFEEVRQELDLEKATQELLKEDTSYFKKQLEAKK